VLPNVTLLPKDQDVKEEAEIIETNLELLQKKNPLVVKDMSKVKSNFLFFGAIGV
jgi:hypothetical protein